MALEITIDEWQSKKIATQIFFNSQPVSYEQIPIGKANLHFIQGFDKNLAAIHVFDTDKKLLDWVKKQKGPEAFLKNHNALNHLRSYADRNKFPEILDFKDIKYSQFLSYQESYLKSEGLLVPNSQKIEPGAQILGTIDIGWYYDNPTYSGKTMIASRFNPILTYMDKCISSYMVIGLIPRAFCTKFFYRGDCYWSWPVANVFKQSFGGLWINNQSRSIF